MSWPRDHSAERAAEKRQRRQVLTALEQGLGHDENGTSSVQIVARSGIPGVLVDALLERLEARGSVAGSGPAAYRRYRLTAVGRQELRSGQRPRGARPAGDVRAALWRTIRQQRDFTQEELADRLAGSGCRVSQASLAAYVGALAGAGYLRRSDRPQRLPADRQKGHGGYRYHLPDDRDPGPLPPRYDAHRRIVFDPNHGDERALPGRRPSPTTPPPTPGVQP
ncbi:MAG: hypothetical protein JNK99_14555 [Candidatus Accumulibacter sp.]|uniref:hypothetical protein n=1 Tax=Accumulibacter sp. TaxID=2053492 RepID=UPI001A3C98F5|nr:hypothetical protein [Accumulibacter sp.]MBL8395943.1 hypothetical protein [Accumulibacter sp.]